MSVHVVRLGSDRLADEGTRIGTVRRPPRGIAKAQFASQNWYDVWFPLLAPSAELMKLGQAAASDAEWAAFSTRYRREMAQPAPAQAIGLLAALSQTGAFSVGCYCEHERRCHRSLLRELLRGAGAKIG